MANPIKPTGPGGLPLPPPTTEPASPVRSSGGADFRRELAGVSPAAPPAAGASPPVPAAGSTEAIFADLRAGRIDRAAALDRLVAGQLARVAPAGLTPAARGELEAVLRGALEHDPGLARLFEDASRES